MAKVENILLKPTTQIEVVTNFSALPDVALAIGLFYWCVESQGTAWLPFNLGGSFYNSGLYYSNGVDWSYQKTPFGATQIEVNAGINNDKFLTSFTFENASKWLSKADLSYVNAHITNTSNPHNVTKTQIGLSNVDNTSDVNKPISTAQSSAINLKEDSVNKSSLTTDSTSSIKFPVWSAIVSYFDINKIKTILGITTLSGSNTGDQTSIVGITGTKAQFNTAVTDGDIQYVGDAPTAHTHTLSNVTDVTITVANLNSLDDGNNSGLHFHDTDRARANHTGTQTASTISDIENTITNNTSVVANTAKVTNATHTGDVTGSTALTLATVNGNVGAFGNATTVPTVTVNEKGLITSVTTNAIQITESQVTNLTTDLANKQATLVSGTNIKTVNGNLLLGSGDIVISGGATNLTYTASATNGIVNSDTGTDATIPLANGTNAGVSLNDYTTTEKNKVSLLSGTNTGDNATNTQYSSLVSNATHIGEVIGSTILSLDKTSITNKTNVVASLTDNILISDTSDFDNLKKISVQSIIDLAPSVSGGTSISANSIFDFLNEKDRITNTILNASITNANIKSFSFIPIETSETSLDDFSLNGLNFCVANIIDNVSFDIIATAINNASGDYTIKYLITI